MKKVDPNIEKLFECYCSTDSEDMRVDVMNLARSVLVRKDLMALLDKLIAYHNCELLVIENSLGLS